MELKEEQAAKPLDVSQANDHSGPQKHMHQQAIITTPERVTMLDLLDRDTAIVECLPFD